MTGDHYGWNCPKAKKKGEENRPITPYPRRDGSASGDRINASQGNETFRRFRGYFGTGPWKVLVEDPVQGTQATAAEGAALIVPAAPTPQKADTAPSAGLEEENRGGRECWECLEQVTGTNHHSPVSDSTNMLWDTLEDTSEDESEFNFLSNLASSLPDDSSEEEDLEIETDPGTSGPGISRGPFWTPNLWRTWRAPIPVLGGRIHHLGLHWGTLVRRRTWKGTREPRWKKNKLRLMRQSNR